MPSIFDFSGAIPWLIQGFLLGLLAYWLYRKYFGSGGHHVAQIADLSAKLNSAHAQMANLKQGSDGLVTKANYYEGEYNTLLSANQALTRDAGDVMRLRTDLAATRGELEKLRAESQSVTAAVEDAYKKQINGLANELNAKSNEATRYASELSSTRADLEKLRTGAAAAASLVEKTYQDKLHHLQSQLNAAGSTNNGEVQRLTGELSTARAALEKLRAESLATAGSIEKTYKEQIGTLQSQLNAAGNVNADVARLSHELAAAKSEITIYGRREEEWRGYEKRYVDDIARLTGELKSAQTAGGEASLLRTEVTRLTNDLTNAKSGATRDMQALIDERNRLKAEADKLARDLAAAHASHQSLAMEHHTTKNDLHQVRSGLEETSLLVAQRHREVEELRAKLAAMPDVESYKRFKDALEAANRIASGQG
jgi:chromosome segregation ATPase